MKSLLKIVFVVSLALIVCNENSFAQLESKRIRMNNNNIPQYCYSLESDEKIAVKPSFDINELCRNIDFKNVTLDSLSQTLIAEVEVKIDKWGNVLQCSKVFKTMNKDANCSPEWTEAVLKGIKQIKFTPAQTEEKAIPVRVRVVVRHNINKLCF